MASQPELPESSLGYADRYYLAPFLRLGDDRLICIVSAVKSASSLRQQLPRNLDVQFHRFQ